MHRSGTSCLMGCLEEAGLFGGDVVRAAPHNAKGNRENLDIRALNDDVLRFSGGSWDEPPPSIEWDDQHVARQRAIIESLTAPGRPWGFKDPRSVLTLPFWRAGIPGLRIVGTFRHPAAVVKSIVARDGTSPEKALRLWTHYNDLIVAELEKQPFPVVCFDLDADAYADAVAVLLVRIGMSSSSGTGFFSDDLRHQRPSTFDEPGLSPTTSALYRRLMEFASMTNR